MHLGSAYLFWGLRDRKTGNLYFGTNLRLHTKWEFAPCSQARLVDVTRKDLDCPFYGERHPQGKAAFGESWRTNSIVVKEGQVLLARLAAKPSVVYVLQLAEQGGDLKNFDWGTIRVEYVQARTR